MYDDFADIFGRLWRAYGGSRAVADSPFFHAAIAVGVAAVFFVDIPRITELSLSVLPSLLGFSIGAYAIVFGLLNERLVEVLAKKEEGEEHSLLAIFSSSFAYFIIVQTVALVVAMWAKISLAEVADFRPMTMFYALANRTTVFVETLSLAYSVLLTAAIALEIFRISTFQDYND